MQTTRAHHVPVLNRAAIWAIRAYQRRLSGRVAAQGYACHHFPTCSEYGVLAFQKHAFRTALRMTLARVRDCGGETSRPFVDLP